MTTKMHSIVYSIHFLENINTEKKAVVIKKIILPLIKLLSLA